MVVVVGSRHDQSAQELVANWARQEAALLTCEDLSSPGWQLRLPDRSRSCAVVGGHIIGEKDIRGVLVRRPWILDKELTHIVADDREYVAAEMSAFLVAWLAGLPCRVLNLPTGTSLCGPNWRPLQWMQAAAAVGIAVPTARLHVPAPRMRKRTPKKTVAPVEVTVVGEQCFGAPDKAYAAAARRLAEQANVGLLSVRFAGRRKAPMFVAATSMPSLKDPEIAQAVCEFLLAAPSNA